MALKGVKQTKEAIKSRSLALTGRKLSEKTKEKIRQANLGKKRPEHSKFMSERIISEETKKKMGEAKRGHNVSNQTRIKISEAQSGEKCRLWQGGISFEPYSIDWTDLLKDSIRQRDDYTCQICGIHQDELQGFHKKLAVHHIDYDKKNLNPENLITLCHNCHGKTNHSRDYWKNYFQIGR